MYELRCQHRGGEGPSAVEVIDIDDDDDMGLFWANICATARDADFIAATPMHPLLSAFQDAPITLHNA